MNTLKRYVPFLTSAMLMYLVLFIIYPHYQYYIDPDGVAYLTVSRRYAEGDYAKAINGYWSPWSCWLTAALIKCGLTAIPASWLINIIGATGFLFISQSFFQKFNIIRQMQWLLNITLALFLCYAVFWQSFDDLWECFFLLTALRIMLSKSFVKRPALWIVYGFTGTLAYFAKAYAFPFFILNTLCCTYLITHGNRNKWLMITATAISVMLLCSLPWLAALHNKYGIWTTSTAGTLNMSWYLVGHPYYKEGIGVLLPPTYPDSPSYWEDPWYVNGTTPHFWNSWHLFGLQILRLGLNTFKFIISGLQVSIFFPAVAVTLLLSFFHKKIKALFSEKIQIVTASFLLFPAGYFLINFESRYLWYMLPLTMLIGVMLMQYIKDEALRKSLTILFPISFLLMPLWSMVSIFHRGDAEYKAAKCLGSMTMPHHIAGNIHPRFMSRLAYFSGAQYYYIPQGRTYEMPKSFIQELDRHNINYYIHIDSEFTNVVADCSAVFYDDSLILSQKLIPAGMPEHLPRVRIYKVVHDK